MASEVPDRQLAQGVCTAERRHRRDSLGDEAVGRLLAATRSVHDQRLDLGMHREMGDRQVVGQVDPGRLHGCGELVASQGPPAGQRGAHCGAGRLERPRVEPEAAVHRACDPVDARTGQRLDPSELGRDEEMPRRPHRMGSDDPALVHRGAERIDRLAGRHALGDPPERAGHVLRLDGAEPADDLRRRRERRSDQPAVAETGMGDRAVRHRPLSLWAVPAGARHDPARLR